MVHFGAMKLGRDMNWNRKNLYSAVSPCCSAIYVDLKCSFLVVAVLYNFNVIAYILCKDA